MKTKLTTIALWTIGGVLFWSLKSIGLIRTHGLKEAVRELKQGGVIIASNHPSLLETAVIPMSLFPYSFICPKTHILWSMPDVALLPRKFKWLYPAIKAIVVDRKSKNGNRDAMNEATKMLRSGGNIVIHPEGGRTWRSEKHIVRNGRHLRAVSNTVPRLAIATDAKIIPLWVEFGKVTTPLTLLSCLCWLLRGNKMELHFGDIYTINKGVSPEDEMLRLENRILSA